MIPRPARRLAHRLALWETGAVATGDITTGPITTRDVTTGVGHAFKGLAAWESRPRRELVVATRAWGEGGARSGSGIGAGRWGARTGTGS